MYVSKIINIIKNLKDSHPKMNIGKHIATALDGEDVWSITDKKFYQLIMKLTKRIVFTFPSSVKCLLYSPSYVATIKQIPIFLVYTL